MRVSEIYGLLYIIEVEIAEAHSNILEIDAALRETEKHLQAAQVSLKTALTFKPQKEEK